MREVSPVVQVNNATTGNTNLVNTSNQELKNGTLNAPFQSSIQQSSSPQSSFLIFLKKQAIKYFYYKQYSDLLDAHVDISLCVEDCAKLIGVEGWAEKRIIRRLFLQCANKKNGNDTYPGGRPNVITIPSMEATEIANCIERNMSTNETLLLLNEERVRSGKQRITQSAIKSCIGRMQPRITSVERLKQGSPNPVSAWAMARKNWVFQLLLRFRETSWDQSVLPPPYFDLTKLGPPISTAQIIYFDEMHKKCYIGTACGAQKQIRFPRDKRGEVTIEDGTYSNERKNFLNVKYPDEIRMCFGVASVKKLDGTRQGVRCKPFDYSGKTLVSIDDYEKLIRDEIDRVKNLKGNCLPWVAHQQDQAVYESDVLTDIKKNDHNQIFTGIGKVTLKKLSDIGIVTVCDILSYKHNAMSRHVETIRTRLQKFNIKQTRPDPTDHKLHLNPYMSLYGDIWREEIVKTTALKPYVCITDLVKHMYQESERVTKGTKYQNN